MTQNEAREALSETWRFSRVGNLIELRELELIGMVQALEASRSSEPPQTPSYAEVQTPR